MADLLGVIFIVIDAVMMKYFNMMNDIKEGKDD